MQKLASFEVNYLQYLDEGGKPANDLPDFADDHEVMVGLYRSMQLLRHLDARAVALQRVGRMRTYPASEGQEAVGVGASSCLSDRDVLVPYYRGTAMMLGHGVQPHEILLYWGGDERGSDYQNPLAKEDFPIAVPIATQMLHAAGVASAIKLRGQKDRAVLTEIGEGGTSEGEFYEALNVAGVWNLPMVCVINNNQWAISVPSEMQTAAQTYAQKAVAAGIEGLQVDGNDVIAVKDAVGKALDKARNGGGATLIEAVTYRLCDHTTADDASRYEDAKARAEAEKKEPLGRLAKYLLNLGAVNEKQLDEFAVAAKAEVEKEVKIYFDILENKPQPPSAMFDYLYAELPERFRAQRDEVMRRGGE
ncbi:MAG: pyruvate dehydrogenase (acetyl-transferring) E1 component subunit alpha [Proteobacteria bacterium]|nr:pyruvate dehydrogenase (acetyl-transferring) E1 component subunit alpha [Pseudomonadota bacterium]